MLPDYGWRWHMQVSNGLELSLTLSHHVQLQAASCTATGGVMYSYKQCDVWCDVMTDGATENSLARAPSHVVVVHDVPAPSASWRL